MRASLVVAVVAVAISCASHKDLLERPAINRGSTAKRHSARSKPRLLVIHNANILTASGAQHSPGTLVAASGIIRYVGSDQNAPPLPPGATVVDAQGRYLTPGLIDSHSHLGVYAQPTMNAHSDGNETIDPITPYARAEYGYWPDDPAIARAAAGGITTALILPGSANLIGGEGLTVHMRPGATIEAVRFDKAPRTLKMACGENPKRVYSEKSGPATRMAEYALLRKAFHQARAYAAKQRRFATKSKKAKRDDDPPDRDLGLDTLRRVLSGEVLVQVHCYRADDMAKIVAIADEFGFSVRSFHHALDAYKIRRDLSRRNIAISTWADWWGFKMEAFDGIPHNAALFTTAGGRAVIHSDSEYDIQRLNQEAAKALYAGRHAGLQVSDDQALRWITANPAWVLGIDAYTGSLDPGKRADMVLWSQHPFSVYALPHQVYSGGVLTFDHRQGLRPSDFELGNSALGSSPPSSAQPRHDP